jgi:NTP pyrophosphatase (non-canonical NTP hydrolase)
MKDINTLAKEVYTNAISKGFWGDGLENPYEVAHRTFGEKIALIHSELSEALEEYRNGRGLNETYFVVSNPAKPEGIPSELADAIIRIFDLAQACNIDLEKAISVKMKYNVGRPFMHGGKRI